MLVQRRSRSCRVARGRNSLKSRSFTTERKTHVWLFDFLEFVAERPLFRTWWGWVLSIIVTVVLAGVVLVLFD